MAAGSIAGSIALALTGLFTIPATTVSIKSSLSQKRDGYERLEKLYEDEDGESRVSERTCSTGLPIYVLFGGTLSGLLISITAAVVSTVRTKNQYTQDWLAFASWVLLTFQAVTLLCEKHPIQRFNAALISSAAFLVLLISICWQVACLGSHSPGRDTPVLALVLRAVQITCASLSCLSCLLLPRRPSVFFKDQPVDGQFTVSMLNRWTFSWAGGLLSFAKRNHGLDMMHLPQLHLRVRSEYLEKYFNRKKRRNMLWKDLYQAHRLELAGQSLIAISQGVIQFAPQLAMYKLLELLQRRSAGVPIANEAWMWVAGLGVSIIVTAWLEAFMHWLVLAELGSPIRSELSALIFSKSTRRKDVKGHQKAMTQTQSDTPILQPPEGEEDEEIQKTRQSVINLIGVDTKRIADFASCHWIFSQTLAKLVTSIFFLVNLIGWPPLLAGFGFSVISLPFNIWASQSYSKTQTGLMKARDQKMVVVTEALQGIRQIKFSALESQWQAKIGKKRAKELALQWKAFAVDTVLIGIWILGPVLLSAVSLSIFALLNGDLSPSIAFTTITVFAQIEMAMAAIPGLTADGLGKPMSLLMGLILRLLTVYIRGLGQSG